MAASSCACGVEDVSEPGLGFFVLLLLIQAVSDQPGQVQKQFPEVLAVSPLKVDSLGHLFFRQGRLLPVLRG